MRKLATLPVTMNRSRAVFVLTGVMAAGKSPVARLLAERFPKAVHVRGDVFRWMIVTGRRDMTFDADSEAEVQLALRHQLAAATSDTYFEAGFSVVVQDIILGDWLSRFAGLIQSRPLFVVVLAPRPDAVKAREVGRAKTGYGAWAIEQLDRVLREETPKLRLWIDSSNQTPKQTTEEILARAWEEATVD